MFLGVLSAKESNVSKRQSLSSAWPISRGLLRFITHYQSEFDQRENSASFPVSKLPLILYSASQAEIKGEGEVAHAQDFMGVLAK